MYTVFLYVLCTHTHSSHKQYLHTIKNIKKKMLMISFKSREGEVGIKGKWYKNKGKMVKKPPTNLVLTLLHICYPFSEPDFLGHLTSAHRNQDFMANFIHWTSNKQ